MTRLPFRISLSASIAGFVAISLVLALIAQHRTAVRRERELKARLVVALQAQFAREHMDRFLGDLGPVILKGATRGERLAVGRDAGFTPTGEALRGQEIRDIAEVLLDPGRYGFINADDLPEPRHGVRLVRGTDTLDILLDDSSSGDGHQDVWVVIRDGQGRIVHESGPMCWNGSRLGQLITRP